MMRAAFAVACLLLASPAVANDLACYTNIKGEMTDFRVNQEEYTRTLEDGRRLAIEKTRSCYQECTWQISVRVIDGDRWAESLALVPDKRFKDVYVQVNTGDASTRGKQGTTVACTAVQ